MGDQTSQNREAGIALVEALVGLVLVMVAALSLGEMTGTGLLLDRSSEDSTVVATLAGDVIEGVRIEEYDTVMIGGSLDRDEAGFADTLDTDGDGRDDYGRRWEVVDLDGMLQVRVSAFALAEMAGPRREATLVTLRAKRYER